MKEGAHDPALKRNPAFAHLDAVAAADWVRVKGYDDYWTLARGNVSYEVTGNHFRFRPANAKRWKQFDYAYPTTRDAMLAAEEHFRTTQNI